MSSTHETEVVRGIRSDYQYGWADPEEYFFKASRGLSHELVDAISEHKSEPEWMRQFRHKSLDYFLARPMPSWGADLSGIDFDNIYYYIRPTEKQAKSWEELPAADCTILAVAHKSFLAKKPEEVLKTIVRQGCLVQVKPAFDAEAFKREGVRVWRL